MFLVIFCWFVLLCYYFVVVGDEILVLMECGLELFLKQYWKLWFFVYFIVIVKFLEEGLYDDVFIVIRVVLEVIFEDKYFIYLDILYEF